MKTQWMMTNALKLACTWFHDPQRKRQEQIASRQRRMVEQAQRDEEALEVAAHDERAQRPASRCGLAAWRESNPRSSSYYE